MSGCKQKEDGGDLCPIVAELAVKVIKRDATIAKLTELEQQLDRIKGLTMKWTNSYHRPIDPSPESIAWDTCIADVLNALKGD